MYVLYHFYFIHLRVSVRIKILLHCVALHCIVLYFTETWCLDLLSN